MRKYFLLLLLVSLTGCTGMPDGVVPVSNFDKQRYLGKWYEIARLDHSFERGLSHVTADYELREDGGIRVINRGFSAAESEWQEAEGKAYFVGNDDIGHLKVSFFGPFYGSYVVFDLDHDNYQYAFISGYNTSYLWLLSRTPEVGKDVKAKFIRLSDKLGFDTDELIFTQQD
ncbi:lipocalin family protein [Nitrosomonas marina]|uniref:Outer membrane lipoprotein Blc n=1 Tax=Nitrosomonas marina TaxID=917 RepID=A0A1H8DWC1_9PROT|nr:lipocalin family protein [Nitrosomonas marina]SEN11562.1 apolipoprotein D and lipocalin family protein [Nitrosomonas marina]